MKVILTGERLKQFLPELTEAERELQNRDHHWYQDADRLKVDISELSPDSLKKLYAFLDSFPDDRSSVMSRNLTKQWIDMQADPDSVKVTKLENIPSAVKSYMEKRAPSRIVFMQEKDGNFLPHFMFNVEFHHSREHIPANVVVSLCYFSICNESKRNRESGIIQRTVSILSEDIRNKTISQVLMDKGMYVETPDRMVSYAKEMEVFQQYRNKDGFQMNVFGKANMMGGWYESGFRPVEHDGVPCKMVVDSPDGEIGRSVTESLFWDGKKKDREDDGTVWQVPMHPIIRMFDLEGHCNYAVHINNMTVYEYDTNVGSKLVLPYDVKELLEILIGHASSTFSDIISGKAGGAIVLCQGAPGTGKTLTAEVYSEVMKRPLYKVQSSQLGIHIDKLEALLKEVLQRAEKWGAILLLDEADVYVRARGNEIEQNAVVGVFLRVLEYYRGVLFMTTNRGTEIDDAIISRLTARITYTIPDENDRRTIWCILAAQNGLTLSEPDLNTLVTEMKDVSGRDIKNLLKLAKMVCDKKKVPVTAKTIQFLAKFKQ